MYQLIGTFVIQLAIAIFVYGRLTERTKVHTEQIGKLGEAKDRHEREIGELYGAAGINRR